MWIQVMLVMGALCAFFAGCNQYPSFKPDFSTPEQALRSLEDAYRSKDVNNVLMCKDFELEARLFMKQRGKDSISHEMIIRDANILEEQFRRQLADGFPEWSGVRAHITHKEELSGEMVVITEKLDLPNGKEMTQRILVGKSTDGWKVLVPYNEPTNQ